MATARTVSEIIVTEAVTMSNVIGIASQLSEIMVILSNTNNSKRIIIIIIITTNKMVFSESTLR